ncbi:hypothetical protein B5723_08070 [Mammaliicoccus sciuri]|uniref:hypothetical protein n=1 Tax=Mammaliicoccus sciuri TaxID=1296 RepID=UPI000A078AF3|nr:hypothetical protein [Mammaliicoccus sciuri]ORI02828.1 hypothetical protein B5723_08070 [Mammaliicoccus sciuri]
MKINFNEDETFHFLSKKDMRNELGVYIYLLTSQQLGSTITVHSEENYDFQFLQSVKLNDVSLFDIDITLYAKNLY